MPILVDCAIVIPPKTCEEIAVILPETGLKDAAAVAEKLRHLVEACRIFIKEGLEITVTISGAVAENGSSSITTNEELIRNADKGLHTAKNVGRNKIEIYKETFG